MNRAYHSRDHSVGGPIRLIDEIRHLRLPITEGDQECPRWLSLFTQVAQKGFPIELAHDPIP
ncbi:hypothetical protein KBI52_21340 [Microvirga sp. HBU67558]|uniref:hypothetical protein n=1 Tax=Microvirga sp. HBU67558 TaxID=2824562 RepID=UPI001B371523|nr:hypothetical protein [Microvirga sp. HBU67558]MBQ0822735.1 hypothetical protein [Microvirga sp. HBU67558]